MRGGWKFLKKGAMAAVFGGLVGFNASFGAIKTEKNIERAEQELQFSSQEKPHEPNPVHILSLSQEKKKNNDYRFGVNFQSFHSKTEISLHGEEIFDLSSAEKTFMPGLEFCRDVQQFQKQILRWGICSHISFTQVNVDLRTSTQFVFENVKLQSFLFTSGPMVDVWLLPKWGVFSGIFLSPGFYLLNRSSRYALANGTFYGGLWDLGVSGRWEWKRWLYAQWAYHWRKLWKNEEGQHVQQHNLIGSFGVRF